MEFILHVSVFSSFFSFTAWKVSRYRVFYWLMFSCIWTKYGDLRVNTRIQFKYRKIWARKNSVFAQFSRSVDCYRKWYVSPCVFLCNENDPRTWNSFDIFESFYVILCCICSKVVFCIYSFVSLSEVRLPFSRSWLFLLDAFLDLHQTSSQTPCVCGNHLCFF